MERAAEGQAARRAVSGAAAAGRRAEDDRGRQYPLETPAPTTTRKRQATATQQSDALSEPTPEPESRWHDANDLRWAARIGVKTPIVHIRQMTTKWGSISTAGRLTLNSELLDLPMTLGEFVVVHELVHLLVPNHGRVFKSFLHAYLPDWQRRERELRAWERARTDGHTR